jgi:regulator of ribosome biosynthesis
MFCRDEYDGALEFDLGNLMAYDPSPILEDSSASSYLNLATRIFQSLAKQIFSLPSEPAPVGRMALLPPPTTVLPREKPLPKPRPPTKWEAFAAKKGIQKKKRSKLVEDTESGEWRRRHGYKKANDELEVPVIEAKPGDKVS